MSHFAHTNFLEYWYNDGLEKGMTENEASDYVDNQTEKYL